MNAGFSGQKRQPVPGEAVQAGLKRSGAPEQAIERIDEPEIPAAMAGAAVGGPLRHGNRLDRAAAVIAQPELRSTGVFLRSPTAE